MAFKSLFYLICMFFISSCAKKPAPPISIGINPWPGYEFIYLAEQKGFFQEEGLNVKLVQQSSLSDVQRAFVNGRIDGMMSTMIEVVQVAQMGLVAPKIVLLPNYSNGGDVIVATEGIQSVADLRGKRLGCEIASLGIYLAHRALSLAGLTLNDVELINVEQLNGEQALREGKVDAYVTYPPYANRLLAGGRVATIFTTAEIPFEIIDTLAVSDQVLQVHPDFVPKLLRIWQKSLDFTAQFPDEAHQIMGQREGLTAAQFKAELERLVMVDLAGQKKLLSDADQIQNLARDVCDVLAGVNAIGKPCEQMTDLVYRGGLE